MGFNLKNEAGGANKLVGAEGLMKSGGDTVMFFGMKLSISDRSLDTSSSWISGTECASMLLRLPRG